jgi:hypothetical protein
MTPCEPLKGSVSYSRTLNLGDYNSLRVEWIEEFRVGERTHEEVTEELEARLAARLKAAGLAK